ncbi:MAG: hypothetical protein HY908_15565 [Myxococcales bacterium]|nr:hypothetical protein [Myxococcales bacterium]
MRTMRRTWSLYLGVAALALAASCQARSRGAEPGDGAADTKGFFVRPEGPHPQACAADADCVSGPGVNPEEGCCDTGVHNSVYSRAYIAWRAAWMHDHCGGVECPLLPPPAPLAACFTDGRCVGGRCKNTCP